MCLFVRFHGNYLIFCIFCRATVCCPLLCLCRPFCSFERCLDWTQRAAGNYREDETAKFPERNLQLCEIQVQQSPAINHSNSFFWRLCPDSWSVRAPGPRRSARTFTPATAAPQSPGGRGCVEKDLFYALKSYETEIFTISDLVPSYCSVHLVLTYFYGLIRIRIDFKRKFRIWIRIKWFVLTRLPLPLHINLSIPAECYP
jgi:hypothetical protein